MAKLGYARVSTRDQDAALQHDALTAAGCERIFTEQASGSTVMRPELERLLDYARRGDVIVVWRLDRFGRSIRHLIEQMDDLESRGIHFVSLQESIDTTTPTGKLTFHIFSALAEFERSLIVERTRAGLEAARARGRLGGRPRKITPMQRTAIYQMYATGDHTGQQIADIFGIARSSVYRVIAEKSAGTPARTPGE